MTVRKIDYKWSSWGQWSNCSSWTDYYGLRKRTANCVPPKYGGKKCPSEVNEKNGYEETDIVDCLGLFE